MFLDNVQTHHNRYDSSGRVIGLSQRHLPDNTHETHNGDIIRVPGGIRTRSPSKREAVNPRLRPRRHCDRQYVITSRFNRLIFNAKIYIKQFSPSVIQSVCLFYGFCQIDFLCSMPPNGSTVPVLADN